MRLLSYAALVKTYTAIIFTSKPELGIDHIGNLKLISVPKRKLIRSLYYVYDYLKKTKAERGADTVISTQDAFEVGFIGYLFALFLRLPLHAQIHTAIQSPYFRKESWRNRLQYVLSTFITRRAKALRVVSPAIKDFLIHKHVVADKIFVAPITGDAPQTVKQSLSPTVERGPYHVLCVARFVECKNLKALIEGFGKFTKTHQGVLTIVGGGPLKTELAAEMHRLGLADTVTLLDWTPSLDATYLKADLYIQPSWYEGFGSAIVEALARGIPVVVTPGVGAADYVKVGVNGYVLKGYTAEDITTGLMYGVDHLVRLSPESVRASMRIPSESEKTTVLMQSWTRALGQSNPMRILMTTEKLDSQDTIFAFSHLWIKTIASQVDHLTVIALSVGAYDLPSNVTVYSLGKEKGVGKMGRVFRFYKYIWQERKNYDNVFVHMNQVYVILGGLFWKIWNKKIGLWYTHRAVSTSLKIATTLVDHIFTAADESFNINTPKKHVLGHGIDTQVWLNPNRASAFSQPVIKIVSVGRLTRIKNLETLVRAAKLVQSKGKIVEVSLIGPTINEADAEYKTELEELIKSLHLEDTVHFLGGKKVEEVRNILWQSDIHVNMCPTGGLDKAVIEAGCAGLHTFASNQAFAASYGSYAADYLFTYGNAEELANRICAIAELPREESEQKRQAIQADWGKRFAVSRLIRDLLNTLQS